MVTLIICGSLIFIHFVSLRRDCFGQYRLCSLLIHALRSVNLQDWSMTVGMCSSTRSCGAAQSNVDFRIEKIHRLVIHT